MLKVGLTGGVACGKSTILAMFERLGAYVLRADELAHTLMEPGKPVYHEIVRAFGRDILDASGAISRPKLAKAAFPHRIRELNAIVHPAVLDATDRWAQDIFARHPEAIVIKEAALLFEAGAETRVDKVITVKCSLEQKIRQFAHRTGLDEAKARAEVLQRMAAQMPEDEKATRSDYVIDNSGSLEDAERQVSEIWKMLKTAAGQ